MSDKLRLATRIVVRELTTADSDQVIAVFEGLSERDRFVRFFRPMPTYPPSVLSLITTMDGADHVAFGAFDGKTCVGVARYIRSATALATAEMAITVSQEFRSRGIARQLVDALDESAQKRGVEAFEIDVHPENRSASEAFRALGFATSFNAGTIRGHRPTGRLPSQAFELAQAA